MRRRSCLILSVLTVALACLPGPLRGQFVYTGGQAADGQEQVVYGYSIDPGTGALTPVPGSPFPVGSMFGPVLATDPSGRFLYALVCLDGCGPTSPNLIHVFGIDPATGALAEIQGSPYAGAYLANIAIHPTDKFAYVTGLADAGYTTWVYLMDPVTGKLIRPIQEVFVEVGGIPNMVVDPAGTFLYLGGTDSVNAYAIDANTGKLTLVPGSPFPAPPFVDTAVGVSGSFVYALGEEGFPTPNVIAGFAVAPLTGALTPVSGSPFLAPNDTVSNQTQGPTAMDPLGRFVYLLSLVGVSTFAVDRTTGSLTMVSEASFPTGPRHVAAGCAGRFVYMLGGASAYTSLGEEIYAFGVSQTGVLTEVAGSPFGPVLETIGQLAVACPPTPSGPVSYVSLLPAFESTLSFPVQWSGTDGLSTISGYTIYVSDNGGPFTTWLTQTPATQAIFAGVNGHTYGFYSIAQDLAGYVEHPKSAAEATTYVDAMKPVSRVSSLPGIESSPNFLVQWSGTDAGGPGIASYSIYVSDNGGPFTAWLTQKNATQGMFTGVNGHTYGFYSISQDIFGNVENPKSAAEATTLVQYPKPVSHVSSLPGIASSPNFLVQWSGTDAGGPGLRNYNIYVSDNGGAFGLWQTNTVATQAWYSGFLGHTYGFFSQATDVDGSQENLKIVADATTQTPAQSAEDVNGDGQINCADASLVKASFGKKTGQPGFNPAADVNKDGVVNVLDLALVRQKLIPGTVCQ